MVIGGTLFAQKKIHLATWKSPGEQYFNHRDHVITGARNVSNLMDVTANREANIDSDHYLTLARVTVRFLNVEKIYVERLEKFVKN
jgi:hypothetical protein